MSKPPTRAALAGARKRYDAGEPVGAVAADLGLSVDAFRRLRVKEGWPLRPNPARAHSAQTKLAPSKLARAAPDAHPPDAPPPARAKPMKKKTPRAQNAEAAVEAGSHPAVDLDALRARLERALQTELAAVERRLTSADPTEPGERNSRALASLVKTFADLRRLAAPARAKAGADDDRPADARPERDLPALRAELARRLERLAGEGRGG